MRSPFSKLLHSLWSRITFNRITTWFFIFSIIHCFVQVIIQALLFSLDNEYNSVLSSITTMGAIPRNNMTYLEGSPGKWHLRMCNDVPYDLKRDPCSSIFQSTIDDHNPIMAGRPAELESDDNHLVDIVANTTGVHISSGSVTVFLDHQCIQTLVYSEQILYNSKREDITFLLLQFWLVIISVFALKTDSVPHTLTVLITRCLMTAWSAYAIYKTNLTQVQFTDIIFTRGTPCFFNLYPSYFQFRMTYQIPDLILNVTALLIAFYLSLKLSRDYSEQSLKCVGAPKHINRFHKLFMAVQACLQLECFVVVANGGLWVDVLVNTAIARISLHTDVYEALFIVTTILLIPWIAMGWYAIRRERKRLMIVFLSIAFSLLTGWSLMFYSIVYRWSFMQWPFLGCFTVASLTLIVASIILSVVCRLNFGKGLAQYLQAESTLAACDFAPEVFKHDEEKGTMDLDDKFQGTYDLLHTTPIVLKHNILQKLRLVHHKHIPSQTPTYEVPYNVPF